MKKTQYFVEPDVILHDDVEHLDAGVDGRDLEGRDEKFFDVLRSTVVGVHLQAMRSADARFRKIILKMNCFVISNKMYNGDFDSKHLLRCLERAYNVLVLLSSKDT